VHQLKDDHARGNSENNAHHQGADKCPSMFFELRQKQKHPNSSRNKQQAQVLTKTISYQSQGWIELSAQHQPCYQ
jgi:hypothetical protein